MAVRLGDRSALGRARYVAGSSNRSVTRLRIHESTADISTNLVLMH